MKASTLWVFVVVLTTIAATAQAASVTTTGGITLWSDGPTVAAATVPNNVALAANGATPFTLDELAGFGHLTIELNDGIYGNSNSWIGNGATGVSGPYAGVAFAGSTNINSISFGRDATGAFFDRSLGTYTLQYRNDGSTADDAGWTTIGTINFSGSQNVPATTSAHRHQFQFGAVDATAVRLLVPATGLGAGTAIDEIEVYSNVPTPVGLTLTQTGPATAANAVPNNLALASNGATAFAKDVILGGTLTSHQTAHLNDGLYGNSNSWIGDTDGTFAGVDLGGFFYIDSIAFGRDNTGAFLDRASGDVTVQFTTVDNPDENTPTDDWFTIAVLNYDGVFPSPNPYLRQEYDLNTRVAATGLRFVTADGGIAGGFAIDEIEVYGTPVPEPGSVVIWTLLGAVGAAFVWRRSQKRTVA